MGRFLKIKFLLLIIVFCSTSVFGADIAKIGVVDFQRVLKDSQAGKTVAKKLREKLREKQKKRTLALKERQKEIITLQKKIEGIELVGDKEERENKQLELNNRIDAFKKLEIKFNKELKDINALGSASIKKEVNELVVKAGKKGGYLLIVEKRDVLYYPDAVDITSKIISTYNQVYKGR